MLGTIATQLCRLAAACIVAPGLGPLVAYLLVVMFNISLPDNFGHQSFLTEAGMFYAAALPLFRFLYAIGAHASFYMLLGCFITWPLWLLLMMFPSDASVDPVNPQLFLAPTTAAFGLLSGWLFTKLSGSSRYRR